MAVVAGRADVGVDPAERVTAAAAAVVAARGVEFLVVVAVAVAVAIVDRVAAAAAAPAVMAMAEASAGEGSDEQVDDCEEGQEDREADSQADPEG